MNTESTFERTWHKTSFFKEFLFFTLDTLWPINICMRLCLHRCASVSHQHIREESASAVSPAAGRGQRDGGNTHLITHILIKKQSRWRNPSLRYIFRSRCRDRCLGTNSLHKSANNSTQQHSQSTLFLYGIVWWNFPPSRPSDQMYCHNLLHLLHYFVCFYLFFLGMQLFCCVYVLIIQMWHLSS